MVPPLTAGLTSSSPDGPRRFFFCDICDPVARCECGEPATFSFYYQAPDGTPPPELSSRRADLSDQIA